MMAIIRVQPPPAAVKRKPAAAHTTLAALTNTVRGKEVSRFNRP